MIDCIRRDERFFGVTLLRAIAVLFLIVHHTLETSRMASAAPQASDWLVRIGEAGVDLLFVATGFLMLYAGFRPGRPVASPAAFLLRRLARLYPLYWVCCLAFLGIWSAGFLKSRDLSAGAVAKSLLLIPSSDTLMGISWILSYLVFFGLIFSATLVFRSRDASIAICTTIIVALLALAPALPAGEISDFLGKPIAVEFCFGMLVARYFLEHGERMPISASWSVLAFAILAIAPPLVPSPDASGLAGLPRVAAWGLPATLLLSAFLSIKPPKTLNARLANLAGDASYAIYLGHFFVMILYAKLLKDTALGHHSQVGAIPLVILICVGVGVAIHLVVERPLTSHLLRLLRPRPDQNEAGPRAI
ncbi:acyltransferase [Bradyrhizobium sp. NP1]|uniref:acyltransferase family protein n=1 Tax=Bradyrhizobium sp. NP1 TaxID=3049772 RepID=UPI0025A56FFC|nr:acyltransferase [Bradyrhizobium sp. NP1]WJR81411.1 acyltransferase [Bradyrhizobium sp. NP1]